MLNKMVRDVRVQNKIMVGAIIVVALIVAYAGVTRSHSKDIKSREVIEEADAAREILNNTKYVHDRISDRCILVHLPSWNRGSMRPVGVTSCDGISVDRIIEPMGYITEAPPEAHDLAE